MIMNPTTSRLAKVMLQRYIIALLVVVCCCSNHVLVSGTIRLTGEMLKKVTTQEELLEALKPKQENNYESHDERMLRRRQKLLQFGVDDSTPVLADRFENKPGFYHGVASGDPLPDAIIIWTRYTPVTVDETITMEVRMVEVNPNETIPDNIFDPVSTVDPAKLFRAKVEVTAESDFTAKIDVTGLKSNTNYVYGFAVGSTISQIGQTRTAPGPTDKVDSMVYAVFSCSEFSKGYFHAYDVASSIEGLDFWIHVGDYVYEYGAYHGEDSDVQSRASSVLPEWEQISLQDYRNRMASYHVDKALQNLRRSAPLIAIWDDHEFTNDSFGNGKAETTGAENHQERCRVGPWATDRMKVRNECDRDEGDATIRFTSAVQSYLEWMPVRRQEAPTGVVTIGSITQVMSWGDMATIVALDTRISHRSEELTGKDTLTDFVPLSLRFRNAESYNDTSSRANRAITELAQELQATMDNPAYTMIGEDMEIIRTNFEKSKAAGQPWQIWATATALGRSIKGDYLTMGSLIDDPDTSARITELAQDLHTGVIGILTRAIYAQAVSKTPWNLDDYSGFAHEQRLILKMLQESASNPIVLAGDLHDSFAWQLYEDGALDGVPVTVNLVGPGTTSAGWGPPVFQVFGKASEILGSDDAVYDLVEAADEANNPGLKYSNIHFKGFFAVKVTKEKHVAEFIYFTDEVMKLPYNDVDDTPAPFFCDGQLTTTAGQPGSLERSDACSAIVYKTARPAAWKLPFPEADTTTLETLTNCGYKQCVWSPVP